MAISNMPIKKKQNFGSKIIYEFERTPIMSTYLLYLGVGEFEYIETNYEIFKFVLLTTKGK